MSWFVVKKWISKFKAVLFSFKIHVHTRHFVVSSILSYWKGSANEEVQSICIWHTVGFTTMTVLSWNNKPLYENKNNWRFCHSPDLYLAGILDAQESIQLALPSLISRPYVRLYKGWSRCFAWDISIPTCNTLNRQPSCFSSNPNTVGQENFMGI